MIYIYIYIYVCVCVCVCVCAFVGCNKNNILVSFVYGFEHVNSMILLHVAFTHPLWDNNVVSKANFA